MARVILLAYTEFHPKFDPTLPWSVWVNEPEAQHADGLSEFAGRLCYQSWKKPNPATSTNQGYLKNILEHEHYSVLEHAGFTVAILDVSRSFTHELVRHRHLSFSQESQRYVEPAGFTIPPLVRDNEEIGKLISKHYTSSKRLYDTLVELITEELRGRWPDLNPRIARKRAREAARAVLPNCTLTSIVVSGNHRAWREVLLKRASPDADLEMREVMIEIFGIAKKLAPNIYQDFVVDHDEFGPFVRRTKP